MASDWHHFSLVAAAGTVLVLILVIIKLHVVHNRRTDWYRDRWRASVDRLLLIQTRSNSERSAQMAHTNTVWKLVYDDETTWYPTKDIGLWHYNKVLYEEEQNQVSDPDVGLYRVEVRRAINKDVACSMMNSNQDGFVLKTTFHRGKGRHLATAMMKNEH